MSPAGGLTLAALVLFRWRRVRRRVESPRSDNFYCI